jgi:hypothetical protein
MTGATTLNHVQAEEKASWILMIAIAFGQATIVARSSWLARPEPRVPPGCHWPVHG